jgi:hypothetical protein
MADQGSVSKLAASAVTPSITPTSAQRNLDASARQAATSSSANAGAGRREDPKSGSRQWVDIDGQQFNKSARRGTYVNILV